MYIMYKKKEKTSGAVVCVGTCVCVSESEAGEWHQDRLRSKYRSIGAKEDGLIRTCELSTRGANKG